MSHALYRAACAEDAAQAAPRIHDSGPSAFGYLFAPDPVGFLERCFARDEGIFGFGNHQVAVLEDRVVAVGAFYDAAALRRRTPGTVWAILRRFGASAPRVLWRGARVERLLAPPRPGELYVAHLGVEPAVRGRGIMAGMLEAEIAQARRRGYRAMSLDVARDNPARRLYERVGFRVVGLRRSALGDERWRVPDHYRMELELER